MEHPQAGLAVVTGATSRIGQAIAQMLAARGHDLALLGRDAVRLEEVRDLCGAEGVSVAVHPFDITDLPALGAAVATIRREQGEPRTLVHPAGIFDWAGPEEADPATWARLVEVNLSAVLRLTHALVPSLLSHPASAVVFIGSGAAYQGFANNAAYVASKHGLLGFGRALFQDLRDRGVKVSVVSPGLVEAGASLGLPKERHPRFLRPEDVAEAVRYVLGSSARACPTEIRLEPQLTPL